MTQVWIVRYDEQLYLFKDLDTVQISVRDMYPTDYHIEVETMSAESVVYIVMHNGRVQDRVAAGLYEVHEKPTVIHRHEFDSPTQPFVQEKRREEF